VLSRLRQSLHAHSRARRLVEGLAVALVVGGLVAAAGRTGFIEAFELKTLDQRFNWRADSTPEHPDIVVVELTDSDLEAVEKEMKQAWPWDRRAYGLAVQWLTEAGAKAIFLDFSFQDSHARFPASDEKFAEAVKAAGNTYIIATFNAPVQRHPEDLPALHERSAGAAPAWMASYPTVTPPLKELIGAARGIVSPTYGKLDKDADGIARRMPVGHAHEGHAYLTPAVAMAAAYLGAPVALEENGARIGDRLLPVDERGRFLIDWHARPRDYNPKGFTLGGVIANRQGKAKVKYDPADFRGKLVFVGATAEGLFDFKVAPTGTMAGVEVHAAAADAILSDRFVTREPRWAAALSALGLAALAGACGLFLRIRTLVPLIACAAAGYTGVAYWSLGEPALWIDLVAPLAALLLSTTGAALVNYAIEGRQRRDIRAKFGTYLTPEYVGLLEENPGLFKLGGEERVGTAFFSDLSGFTAMSEKMTASELVARMNEYLTLMTRSIKNFRGTVDKYEGDAIVAFWNAPIPQPDHALLACRAALDNQKELAGLRERWQRDYGVTVVARIGINTGKMIFGNMGSEEKFNYTMMGDPVNLASRLEGANKDYGTWIMIGPETHAMVKDELECRELDLIKVKGKQIPVTVYEVICEKGGLDGRTKECLERYTNGLEAYRMKQFLAAERLFREALEIKADDGPSRLYLERSRHLLEKPPEPGWTYIYEKKDK
jgi:adenylate cyclase